MSGGVRAVQQIGSLLTQAGVPPGISLDISQRLLTATNAGKRLINSSDASNSEFYNKFKSSEASLRYSEDERASLDGLDSVDGLEGAAGKRGRNGAISYYVYERDGKDGKDAEVDYDRIKDLIDKAVRDAIRQVSGGGGILIVIGGIQADLREVWKAIRKLQDKDKEHDKKIGDLEKGLTQAKKDIKKIKEMLENTIEC
jgi:hypothetical protein